MTSFAIAQTDFGAPRTSFWLDIVPALIEGARNKTVVHVVEADPFSERFGVDATTAYNLILILIVVSVILFLCLSVSLVWVYSRLRLKNNRYCRANQEGQ